MQAQIYITYDAESDTAYIALGSQPDRVTESRAINPDVTADFIDGRLCGIELVTASRTVGL